MNQAEQDAAMGLCTVCSGKRQVKVVNMTWTHWLWPWKWVRCNWCFGTGKLNP